MAAAGSAAVNPTGSKMLRASRVLSARGGLPLAIGPGEGHPSRPMPALRSLEHRHAGIEFDEIQRRILDGNPEGWRLFVERYSATVYAFALRLAGKVAGLPPEETAQSVYLEVFERLADDDSRLLREFRGDARIETYLFCIVRNEISRQKRESETHRRRAGPYLEDDSNEDTSRRRGSLSLPTFAESIGLDPGRVAALVSGALARLQPRERLILRLRFREGLSYRGLAGLFGWKDTNASAYEVCKILRKLDLLEQCRRNFHWGEPEREVLRRCLRRWLEAGPQAGDVGEMP
jgi:RNA polymerase sigma factor (sigma-70 family)